MKKSDLKTGMVVEYRSGHKRIVLADAGIFIGKDDYDEIKDINDNLKCKHSQCFDIIAVYDTPKLYQSYINIDAQRQLIWLR